MGLYLSVDRPTCFSGDAAFFEKIPVLEMHVCHKLKKNIQMFSEVQETEIKAEKTSTVYIYNNCSMYHRAEIPPSAACNMFWGKGRVLL